MSKEDSFWFAVAGAVVWLAATLFYAAFAGGLIEQAFWFYTLNAALVASAIAFFFHLTARLRRLPQRWRAPAALAFGVPGLAGSILVLALFDTLMPELPPESLGRYGAFVVVAYGVLALLALERPARTA
ncbi:MAG: DUF5367 family protein [Phenylobacterium sp.]|uniref:DUF5367 family protein n=1 Tax=Phenylobacterium sp. TaxID=1871053 RepID=UPI00271966D5|nr:DUF5367 family protein [Phenylobacterium sp.]MDO8900846.1 DUF5367 family protein [Phenylobacterium sp.]MDP2212924.1 DUF5367 family protein [Phenylobacterium sp.]